MVPDKRGALPLHLWYDWPDWGLQQDAHSGHATRGQGAAGGLRLPPAAPVVGHRPQRGARPCKLAAPAVLRIELPGLLRLCCCRTSAPAALTAYSHHWVPPPCRQSYWHQSLWAFMCLMTVCLSSKRAVSGPPAAAHFQLAAQTQPKP